MSLVLALISLEDCVVDSISTLATTDTTGIPPLAQRLPWIVRPRADCGLPVGNVFPVASRPGERFVSRCLSPNSVPWGMHGGTRCPAGVLSRLGILAVRTTEKLFQSSPCRSVSKESVFENCELFHETVRESNPVKAHRQSNLTMRFHRRASFRCVFSCAVFGVCIHPVQHRYFEPISGIPSSSRCVSGISSKHSNFDIWIRTNQL